MSLGNLKPDDIVFLDFETYYDSNVGFSKLSTTEYVRHPEFSVHMVGLRTGTQPAVWYANEDVEPALRAIDWSNKYLAAHNCAFDGFIMTQLYGIIPKGYIDTLSMARAVHGLHHKHSLAVLAELHNLGVKNKAALESTKGVRRLSPELLQTLGVYCAADTDMLAELFWKLYPHVVDDEMDLIDVTIRMFCEPVFLLDEERVEAELAKEVSEKALAVENSGLSAKELGKNEIFAEALRKLGIDPPTKISPTTGKKVYAFAKTDLGFMELLNHTRADVQDLAIGRLRVKSSIGETRANRLLTISRDNGSVPVMLNYWGAHTGRWSGANKMNLQNLKRGGELRKSLVAPPGHVVLVADSAQIEARVLAWLAGQKNIVDAFAAKQDVYKMMAASIYGIDEKDVDKDKRFVGKVCVLGLGYGMGGTKLHDTLVKGAMGPPVDLGLDECKRIVYVYRKSNAHIVQLWKTANEVLSAMTWGHTGEFPGGVLQYGKNFVRLPTGMYLHYYGLTGTETELGVNFTYAARYGMTKIYGGLFVENIVQALARNIVAWQMLQAHRAGLRIATMTHDEIVCVVPEEEADAQLGALMGIMRQVPDWAKGIPVDCEGGYDVCYSK